MNTFPANTTADKYLVDRVLNGDKQAFSVIIHRTESLVAQMVFKMIPREVDRKDIVQEIYLKVYKSLSGFRYQAKLSTWIGQITYNTCISYLRSKRLLLTDPDEKDDNGDLVQATEPEVPEGPDDALFQKQRLALVQQAMEKLSPIHRTLITLYHQEEMSYQEIGVITNLPEGTVKSYLFRARKALKEHLLRNYKRDEL